MNVHGILHKMATKLESNSVEYSLQLQDLTLDLNSLINKSIRIEWTGKIFCIHCGKKTNKSYGQGFCYPCFISVPETEECVLKPELCKAHLGIARDIEFAKTHCLIPHYVYIAESSGIKVGITRNTQIPTRWIDQGAIQAGIIAETPNRYTAGIIEVFLKKYVSDKTNWRQMLTKSECEYNLLQEIKKYKGLLPPEFKDFVYDSENIFHIQYPGIIENKKINSIHLNDIPNINKKLQAIKGQYLIFADGFVINIRSHCGYEVEMFL